MGHVVENARLQAACLAAMHSSSGDDAGLDVRWPVSVKALQLPPYSSAKGAGTAMCKCALHLSRLLASTWHHSIKHRQTSSVKRSLQVLVKQTASLRDKHEGMTATSAVRSSCRR